LYLFSARISLQSRFDEANETLSSDDTPSDTPTLRASKRLKALPKTSYADYYLNVVASSASPGSGSDESHDSSFDTTEDETDEEEGGGIARSRNTPSRIKHQGASFIEKNSLCLTPKAFRMIAKNEMGK